MKYTAVSAIVLATFLFLGWLTARQIIVALAEDKSNTIIKEALQKTPDATGEEKIIAIASQIFKNFHHQDPATIPLLRFRGYITNQRLPKFIRLPNGVMETLIQKGYCDNAARVLSFALKQENIKAVQWNMVSANGGHSALLVTTPDNEEVLVDPFYGYITINEKKQLIHPKTAQEQMKSGKNFKEIFLPLGENSYPDFYKEFKNMSMAAEGEDLTLRSILPKLHDTPLILGQINNDELDVKSAGALHGLNPYWHYMGHKYNREWVRILTVNEPVHIVMTLVAPVETGILTATPPPVVEGYKLVWDLRAGESITLTDKLAKLSLRRLNSYIGVDQIAIYPGP